jgi:hypothetical protein
MFVGFLRLGLQYYFTGKSLTTIILTRWFAEIHLFIAGEKEIRCWVIQKGTLAPQAAGVIHGDFERGFIKAEVVAYQDFFDLCEGGKSMGPIKAAGKFRQEGKTYVRTNLRYLISALTFSHRLFKTEILSISSSVSSVTYLMNSFIERSLQSIDVAPPKKK